MPIVVKGERDGLVLTLPALGSNAAVYEELSAYLEQAGGFFKGAKVTIDVGERLLSQAELEAIRELLRAVEVQSDTLRSFNDETRTAALALEMEVPFVVAPDIAQPTPLVTLPEESIEALLVRRTLRSGQSIRYPGAVVVLGDVNPGAEVIAGGDVIVWGALRGLVHAGATGDEHAKVCALHLAANQLRIAQHIALAPDSTDGKQRFWQRKKVAAPELARVQEGGIVVEKWVKGSG
jgi:septum site-determining protein MinC